jgi:hypothetical protein
MATAIDFLRLYREFQLEPGASIDDLRRAYRRQVSMVHPDKLDAKDAISQQLATEHLQRLTTLYEAGVQFHRLHGRLPGSSTVGDSRFEPDRGEVEPRIAPPRPAPSKRLRWTVSALLLTCALAWWLWPASSEDAAVTIQPIPISPSRLLGARTPTAIRGKDGIQMGMGKDAVIRIIGAPVMREGERWLYGPSWILFQEGKVAEWYSSPLHPLRISSEPANEGDRSNPLQ